MGPVGAHRRLMLALAAVGLLVSVGGCAPGGIAGGGKGQASGATAATVASTDRATVDGDTGDTTDDGDTTDHDDEHEDAANDDAGVSGETVRRSAPVTNARPSRPSVRPDARAAR